MSHFSVMVLSEDDTYPEGLIERYYEGIEVEPYVKYTKEGLIAEKRKEWLDYKETTYNKYLQDTKAYEEKYKESNPGHVDYLKNTFPEILKRINDDEWVYQKAISYYEEDEIAEDGSIMSTYNPDSKWDWYEIGGRWAGSLILKNGEIADSEYACNIDFAETYKDHLWDVIVEGAEPSTTVERHMKDVYSKEYVLKKWSTKDKFLADSLFGTYAVVTPDGEWHEPGRMGWFGLSFASEEEQDDWDKNYSKFVDEAVENNYYVTIVDCHI